MVDPFVQENLKQPEQPDLVLEGSMFAIEMVEKFHRHQLFEELPTTSYFVRADAFEHIALGHRFVVALNPEPLDYNRLPPYPKWTDFLAERLSSTCVPRFAGPWNLTNVLSGMHCRETPTTTSWNRFSVIFCRTIAL